MKKKFLVVLAFASLLLVACNTSDYARKTDDYDLADYNDDIAYYRRSPYDSNRADRHYDFVSELGFENVVNPNGYTYHERYLLDKTSAVFNDVFHGWRHTWVEPSGYINKEIDVYRYTGDYNGEPRTIHIKSYNGEVLGGYHFGEGETAEDARMIDHSGYSSRLADDFREAWDRLFDI